MTVLLSVCVRATMILKDMNLQNPEANARSGTLDLDQTV